jgi:hypothetical protein
MLRLVLSALKPGGILVVMDGMWNEHESRPREEQVKFHELAPALSRPEVEQAGFEIVEVRDPFIERAADCHLNRKIDEIIMQAGFRIAELTTLYIPGPRPMTYTYQGAAQKFA